MCRRFARQPWRRCYRELTLSLGGGWRDVEIVHAVHGALPFVRRRIRGQAEACWFTFQLPL
jgi:hypothetical protein